MAYSGFTSSDYFTVAHNYNSASALSICAWINRGASSGGSLVALWEDGPSQFQALISPGTAGGLVVAVNVDPAGNLVAVSPDGDIPADTWTLIGLSWAQGQPCRAWVNSANTASSGSNSDLLTNRGSVGYGIGARHAGNSPATGCVVAEVGFFTRELVAADWAALAKGLSPMRIPGIDMYIPLVRNVAEFRANRVITTQGTPAVSSHPRIYR